MNKNLRRIFAGAGTTFLAVFGMQAQASHYQGSELTYTCVAPNMYQVDLKLYRDCSGAAAPTSATLKLQSNGCSAPARNVTMTKVGATTIGNLYCPQLGPAVCTSTGRPNYEEIIFTASVTFSAAELQCQDWLMSWTECCRPSSANLANAAGSSLYTEAYINLGNQNTGPLNNSSAKFQSIVVPYINKYKPILLSSNAFDADDDSLVYSLIAPLDAPNTPVQYSSYNGQGGIMVNPQDSTQFVMLPTTTYTYTPTFPMPSYSVNWSVPNPAPVASFVLDPNNGSLQLTPSVYVPNSTSAQGMNKYVVVVKVDEYRKVAGAIVKVGSVRRDMFITVIDCGPNQNPMVATPVANNQALTDGTIINLRPGTPLTFTFAADDNNANDVLQLESNASAILPGAVFTKTAANRPTGTITWTPTANDVRSQVYYFRVSVQDNACPVKGQQVKMFGVRVSNIGGVTGLSEVAQNQAVFLAYPNPFASEITFKVKQTQANQQIIIYNVLGQQIDRLPLNGRMNAEQEVIWKNAGKYPAGQYVARFNNASGQSLKINKLQ